MQTPNSNNQPQPNQQPNPQQVPQPNQQQVQQPNSQQVPQPNQQQVQQPNPQPIKQIQGTPRAVPTSPISQSQLVQSNRPPRQGQPRRGGGGPNPRKLLMGCISFFGCSLILFVIFVVAFVASTSASGSNGLAQALGVNAADFTNTLITLTNLIFGLLVMILFFVMIIGFAKNLAAPKVDTVAKSKGLKQGLIALLIFVLLLGIWVVVYLYLIGKRVNIPTSPNLTTFQTTPAKTTRQIAPFKVTFNATKLPYNSNQVNIVFYQWDFGDNSPTSSTPIVTHTYTTVGQYTAKLIVTARNKTTHKELNQNFSKLITIVGAKLVAGFTITPSTGPAPLTIAFDASKSASPGGKITAYDWDFSGHNTFKDGSGKTVSHTFDKEGDYKVALRVTDNTGQKPVILSKTITVTGPNIPVPIINIPTTDGKYYTNTQYAFSGNKTTSPNGNITKYEWAFGDNSPHANTRNADHTYTKAGKYDISLTATDVQNKVGKASQTITVINRAVPPIAVITTTPAVDSKTHSISGQVPFEISFSGKKSHDSGNIIDYKWDFDGNGTNDAAGQSVKYVYKKAGVYNVKLTAIDANGLQGSTVQVVKVTPQGLQARLTADKVEGTAPLTVNFDATGSTYPSKQISSYEWNFGDGSPRRIDAGTVSYKYTSIGTFTASVTAKASDGKTSTATLVINVRPIALTACFVPSLESGPAPLSVEFDPRCSQGAVAKYSWDFGDGNTSITRKPTETFTKPGTYHITLEVTDNDNVIDTFSKNILVTGTVL